METNRIITTILIVFAATGSFGFPLRVQQSKLILTKNFVVHESENTSRECNYTIYAEMVPNETIARKMMPSFTVPDTDMCAIGCLKANCTYAVFSSILKPLSKGTSLATCTLYRKKIDNHEENETDLVPFNFAKTIFPIQCGNKPGHEVTGSSQHWETTTGPTSASESTESDTTPVTESTIMSISAETTGGLSTEKILTDSTISTLEETTGGPTTETIPLGSTTSTSGETRSSRFTEKIPPNSTISTSEVTISGQTTETIPIESTSTSDETTSSISTEKIPTDSTISTLEETTGGPTTETIPLGSIISTSGEKTSSLSTEKISTDSIISTSEETTSGLTTETIPTESTVSTSGDRHFLHQLICDFCGIC